MLFLFSGQVHTYTGLENEYMDDLDIDAFSTKPNHDLRGLYSTLKHHPELMDRRLKIGGITPPPLPEKVDFPSIRVSIFPGASQCNEKERKEYCADKK